jgi:hypothetical protein
MPSWERPSETTALTEIVLTHADAQRLADLPISEDRPVSAYVIAREIYRLLTTPPPHPRRLDGHRTHFGKAERFNRTLADALADLGAQPRFTRAYRPQTNGKAERFNRTLAEEWAYIRPFESSAQRTAALPGWLHTYNHHRSHTALDGQPQISRVKDLPGHYS